MRLSFIDVDESSCCHPADLSSPLRGVFDQNVHECEHEILLEAVVSLLQYYVLNSFSPLRSPRELLYLLSSGYLQVQYKKSNIIVALAHLVPNSLLCQS